MYDREDDEDEDYEGPVIYPERFNKWVLLRAGLDFAGHILEGAHCALQILGRGVLAAEVYEAERKCFEEDVRAELEMLPEAESE